MASTARWCCCGCPNGYPRLQVTVTFTGTPAKIASSMAGSPSAVPGILMNRFGRPARPCRSRAAASVRSTLELLSAAYAVHPGFGEGRILELCAHCRPTLPDNLPAVHEIAPRVLQVNGLYRHGFMISPAMLDAVLEWMQQGSTELAAQLQLRFTTLAATPA